MTYTVNVVQHQPNGASTVHTRTVDATSPDEAITMVERQGLDYHEAEVLDSKGDQIAVYGANLWREEWDDA